MKSESGFSLIEVLIVIALIGIVAAIATMNSDFVQRHQLTAASRGLYSDLQKIRQDALTRGSVANSRGFGIRFASNTSYSTFEFNDADGDFTYDGTGEESGAAQKTLSSVAVTIGDAGDPTNNVLIYDKRGMTRAVNWSSAGGRTYVLRATRVSQARCVSVSTVRIREGVWNGASCSEF